MPIDLDFNKNTTKLLVGLPEEIRKKINKTKQTRGAQPYERVPYQNRVNREGIALVPYAFRKQLHPSGFPSGYRIMIRPTEYFRANGKIRDDFDDKVTVGNNAFLYYGNRRDWGEYPPLPAWTPCKDRSGKGHYIARVPATTASDSAEAKEIVEGEPQGIRFFEYASPEDLDHTVAQLAWLAWHTEAIDLVRTDGSKGVPEPLLAYLAKRKLDDMQRFVDIGGLMQQSPGCFRTICPLCRAAISAEGLMSRVEQMEGREISDLTVTEVNLFHIKELRPGEYNHRPYNLTWGHHHCNAVARDNGVPKTIAWMQDVLGRHGFTITKQH